MRVGWLLLKAGLRELVVEAKDWKAELEAVEQVMILVTDLMG